jgi:type IV pilus assembly protein PilC
MALFNYKVRDKLGKLTEASITAVDEAAVIRNLRQSGCAIISVEEQSEVKLKFEEISRRFQKVGRKDVLFFVRQMATLLKAGVPLIASLNSINEQTKNPVFKSALSTISKDINAGVSLSDSLAKFPEIFDDFFVSMTKVGESAGILDSVLERLSQLLSQEVEIRSRIKSAMTYPVLLVFVAIGIITFILTAVIPKFKTIFETYDAKLPVSTTILLGASAAIQKGWPVILIAIGGLALWFKSYTKAEEGRRKFSAFILKIPIFGLFYLKVLIAQFAHTLSSLVKSGVPILEALRVTERTVTNLSVRKIIANVQVAISHGESLSDSFKKSGLFPVMVIQMISVGEKTGKLEQMMNELANFYDQEIEYAIRDMTAVLEPLLLLVMGSGVAFIALSVLMPIFNLVKVFRH